MNRIQAVEGKEDIDQLFFRYARTMVTHLDDGVRVCRRSSMSYTHFRFSAVGCIVHGIAHNIFNRATQ